jgi:hypothetical protein
VEAANERLAEDGVEPLPEGLTPHSLRRTFASILVVLNRDLAVIMRQMGHAGPEMTLGDHAAAMDWADGERERLQALVREAPEGQSADKRRPWTPWPRSSSRPPDPQNPAGSGVLPIGAGGFEPPTSCSQS